MAGRGDSDTREKLIDTAMELFQRHGYGDTGLSQILKAASVNSGSLYYFFESKEALLLAVLEKYKAMLWPMVMQPVFDRVSDPIERIFELLGQYRTWLVMTNCEYGCPIGNLALEMSEKSEAVRVKVAENFEGWRLAVLGCLNGAGERLAADVDREGLATLVLTVMEGGVMQSRAHRSMGPFDASVAMLRDYFARLMRHSGEISHKSSGEISGETTRADE